MAGERPPDNPRRNLFSPNGGTNKSTNNGSSNSNPANKNGSGRSGSTPPGANKTYQPFPDREYERPRRATPSSSTAPRARQEPPPPVNRQPPQPPGRFFPREEVSRNRQNPAPVPAPVRPQPRSRSKAQVAAPARKPGTAKKVFLYGGLITAVIVLLVGLYIITRVSNLFSGISVPRVDVNGQAVTGSNVNGNGKVNILLLGLDSRSDPTEGIRSDTMLLVSVDQGTKTASILSIPRDLWVTIPGHGQNRINAAYSFGDQDKPGVGGPPLAKLAVEQNFGIPVQYFAQVDFNGFRDIVDAIGGINLNVKKPLIDAEYPTEDYGLKRIFIPAGFQHMDGQTALEYARSRHADSDLGRNQRQQEVLMAIRDRGANLGLLTNDKLNLAIQHAIKTDLQWNDVLSLAQTAIGMDKANIRSYSIDANMVKNVNIGGNDVLQPDWDSIRELIKKFNNA